MALPYSVNNTKTAKNTDDSEQRNDFAAILKRATHPLTLAEIDKKGRALAKSDGEGMLSAVNNRQGTSLAKGGRNGKKDIKSQNSFASALEQANTKF